MNHRPTSSLGRLLNRRQAAIAIALVIAVAAVPLLLRQTEDEPQSAPVPPTTSLTTPDETVVAADTRSGASRTLGSQKDPFRPQARRGGSRKPDRQRERRGSTQGTAERAAGSAPGQTTRSGTSTPTAGGGLAPEPTATPPGSTPTRPTPADAGEPGDPAPRTPTTRSVPALATVRQPVIRHGSTRGALRVTAARRLASFPHARPAALLLGLTTSRDAVFVLAPDTTVTGAGECWPTLEDCRTVTLDRGDVAFVSRDGREQRIELLAVRSRRVDRSTAHAARAAVAPRGRETLRGLLDRIGGLRYSEDTGTVG